MNHGDRDFGSWEMFAKDNDFVEGQLGKGPVGKGVKWHLPGYIIQYRR